MIVTIHKIIFLITSPQSKVTQLPTVAVLERRSSLFRRPPGYHHLGSIPKSAHTHIYTQTHTHDTHKHTHMTHTNTHTHTHTNTHTHTHTIASLSIKISIEERWSYLRARPHSHHNPIVKRHKLEH